MAIVEQESLIREELGFLHVKTEAELETFNSIWMENWKKKGFELETYGGIAERFIIHSKSGIPAGTVEFVPYRPDYRNLRETSTIEDLFCFTKIGQVKKHIDRCYEVDKVAILSEFRGQMVLDSLLNLIFRFSVQHNIKYYLAVIDPLFFRTLRHYNVHVEKVGEVIEYKGYRVIPSLIDAEYGIKNKKELDWYVEHDELETQEVLHHS